MEIIVIIIIVVIVSLLSAANKKKPRRDSEDAPMRPTLSDIQRAFMMSSEMETPKRAPETREAPSFVKPSIQQTTAAPPPPRVSSRMEQSVSTFQAPNRYASVDLATFKSDSGEIGEKPKLTVRRQQSALKLFEDKDDFVRAVIYSEILTRKAR